jgi:hypothetical protein
MSHFNLIGKLIAPFRTCPEVQPWLYGYDAVQEVEETVAKNTSLFSNPEVSSDYINDWIFKVLSWIKEVVRTLST